MLKKTVLCLPLLALTMTWGAAFAQDQEAPKAPEPLTFYKLDWVVKEVEAGKVLNARAYSMIVVKEGLGSIRTGNRVPYRTPDTMGFQYSDLGVNIDCRSISPVEGGLTLSVSSEISSVPADTGEAGAPPTIRHNRWNSNVVVPLGKPTLLFSADDPGSKRQMQLELTATPIK